jgi:IclR family transcriptional regulator, acetate operon repressor
MCSNPFVHPLSGESARQPSPDSARLAGAERVLFVLKALAAYPNGVDLDRLARDLDIPKSSLHRALKVLRSARLTEQDGRGRYRLSLELVRLALDYYHGLDRRALVLPALEALVDRFAETAHYAELDGAEIVYVAKVDPAPGSMRMSSVVGGRNPAHCTALGKALLAYALLDRNAIERFAADHSPVRRTAHTLVTPDELEPELADVRLNGFAVDDQESELGVNCIAFPVFLESSGHPSGAISVAAITQRTPLGQLTAVADDIRAVIHAHLGEVTR